MSHSVKTGQCADH